MPKYKSADTLMGESKSAVIIVLLYTLFLKCVFFNHNFTKFYTETFSLTLTSEDLPKFNIDKNIDTELKWLFYDWIPFSSHSSDSELRLFALKFYTRYIGEKNQSLLNVPHHAMRFRYSLTSSEPWISTDGFSKV